MPRRYEDEYRGDRGHESGQHSDYGEGRYGRGYGDEDYGSSKHGRTRHESAEEEYENRRRGALKGWGEDPERYGRDEGRPSHSRSSRYED